MKIRFSRKTSQIDVLHALLHSDTGAEPEERVIAAGMLIDGLNLTNSSLARYWR